MFENRVGPIEPLGGQYDGYQSQELPNGDIVIYRHDFSVVGTAFSWPAAVELMRGDEPGGPYDD